MATTVNILSAENALLTSTSACVAVSVAQSAPSWISSNSTISVIPTEFITNLRYALRVAPSGSGDVTVALISEPLRLVENGKILSFNAKVKPPSDVVVTTTLSVDGESTPTGHGQELSGGQYGAIQSNRVEIPDDETLHSISASITVSGHGGQNFYITYPNLIDDRAFYQNRMVPLSRNLLPDFYWEKDSLEEYPTAPFFRLIDILTTGIHEVMLEYQAFYKYERDEVTNRSDLYLPISRSALVHPSAVRDKYINWLAQFTGSSVRKNIADANGVSFFADHAIERGFIEWQLESSTYGRAAGTTGALASAAKQVLIYTKDGEDSTQQVSITPNYNNNSWYFLVRTLTNETPDASNGESSHLVLAAMEPARPMGYQIFHETIDEFYLTLDDLSFGVLDGIQLGPVSIPDGAPENVTVVSTTSTTAVLTFLPLSVPGGGDGGGVISNYVYALSTNGGSTYGSYQTLSPAKGSPPITITGLTSATTYHVKLKAINEAGTSAVESAAVSFTTL